MRAVHVFSIVLPFNWLIFIRRRFVFDVGRFVLDQFGRFVDIRIISIVLLSLFRASSGTVRAAA